MCKTNISYCIRRAGVVTVSLFLTPLLKQPWMPSTRSCFVTRYQDRLRWSLALFKLPTRLFSWPPFSRRWTGILFGTCPMLQPIFLWLSFMWIYLPFPLFFVIFPHLSVLLHLLGIPHLHENRPIVTSWSDFLFGVWIYRCSTSTGCSCSWQYVMLTKSVELSRWNYGTMVNYKAWWTVITINLATFAQQLWRRRRY